MYILPNTKMYLHLNAGESRFENVCDADSKVAFVYSSNRNLPTGSANANPLPSAYVVGQAGYSMGGRVRSFESTPGVASARATPAEAHPAGV